MKKLYTLLVVALFSVQAVFAGATCTIDTTNTKTRLKTCQPVLTTQLTLIPATLMAAIMVAHFYMATLPIR